MRLGLVVQGEDGRPGLALDDLSTTTHQGFRSGSGLDPYSIGPVDPDPDPYSESGSGSGSRRAKMTHKSRKNSCFEVLDGLFVSCRLLL